MELTIYTTRRSWKHEDESSYEVICFALDKKPNEAFGIVKDSRIPELWNIHYMSENYNLTESEIEFLTQKIIDYIQPGEYLSSCGTCSDFEYQIFKKIGYRTLYFKETNCIRVLHDKYDDHCVYYHILKKI